MSSNAGLVSLEILIVGAGIAGLTAAAALKEAGHKVTLFESSKFLHEIGAAVALAPNGTRVLAKLGFNFPAARGVRIDLLQVNDGKTLEDKQLFPRGAMDHIEETYGFPHSAFHRVDLHNELQKMALNDSASGPKVGLHLGVKIVRVDVAKAEIELDDGRVWNGDLLIGADGIHSVVRQFALGLTENKWDVSEGEWDIYRWLLDTKVVEDDAELKSLMIPGRQSFVLPYRGKVLSLIWYACRDGEVQNFAAFSPSSQKEVEREDYDASADKDELLQKFSEYHPALLRLIQKAETIKTWRLRNRTPLDTYVYGKTLLIGDAAHPMLPWNSQGANQALEDCGALLALFANLESKSSLSERMNMFDQARRKRANRWQILSSVTPDQVKNLGDKLKGYEDEAPKDSTEPENARQRLTGQFGYNVFAKCEQILKGAM